MKITSVALKGMGFLNYFALGNPIANANTGKMEEELGIVEEITYKEHGLPGMRRALYKIDTSSGASFLIPLDVVVFISTMDDKKGGIL